MANARTSKLLSRWTQMLQDRTGLIVVVGVVLYMAIFALDLSVPLGVAAGVPYVVVVLISVRLPRRWHTLASAAVATLLVVAGMVFSPPADELWKGMANRVIAVSAIWLTAFLCSWQRRRIHQETQLATEKELAERVNVVLRKALKELEDQKFALDQHAIVSIVDVHGRFIYVNEKFCQTSGYEHHELIRQTHAIINSGEHSGEFYAQLWGVISQGGVWHGEIKNRSKEGPFFWVDTTIVPFTDEDGTIVQYVGIQTDVTEQKLAEGKRKQYTRALAAKNLELESQQEELKAKHNQLEEVAKHLERAQVKALAATQAKSEFLANMSHEIRTPMTAILGFADVLVELDDPATAPPERIDAAQTIKRNGEFLLRILNDVLDLSKIEAGKLEVERIPCSPLELLNDVASMMRQRAEAKGLSLHVEFASPIPNIIQADPTRLRQILINLLSNAIRFTQTGSIRVVTQVVDVDGAQPKIRFDVIDTGVGIPSDQLAHLFQPFTQADNSTTRKFGGTGLGLTISQRLARMLGGEISVESKPGRGSTFKVTASTGPLTDVKMIDPSLPGRTATSGVPASPTSNPSEDRLNCRILLAEDGPDNQRLITFILKKAGADVTVAGDGQIAVEQALAAREQRRPFDIILMDMQMPVMDGYQATRTLREQGYEGPIIALTAHAMTTDRQKCLDAGCDDFASKPIDRAKLVDLIRSHVNRLADSPESAKTVAGVGNA